MQKSGNLKHDIFCNAKFFIMVKFHIDRLKMKLKKVITTLVFLLLHMPTVTLSLFIQVYKWVPANF